MPNHEVRVVDHAGREVADRTEGFLWFRGPSATSGYYDNPEATARLFPLGPATDGQFAWVDTGDRAYRADGEIFVTGRLKDIIIKGGRNLYPHEVEELAGRAAGIRKGCIVAFGVKDFSSGTEKLVIVAESRETDPSRRSTIAAAVTHEVSQGLGLPPDRVELIPPGSIPKTSSGKLRREETRELYLRGTLSAKKRPAWLQIARLGTSGAVKNIFQGAMAGVRRGLEILHGLYFIALFMLCIIPAWAGLLFFRDHRAAGRYTSAALKFLFFLSGTRVRVVGKELMDTPGAKIYASNHTSYFDVLPLMMGLGVPYRFIAKEEVHKMPFIGTFLRKMGHLSFVRTDANARRDAAQQIEACVRDGDSVFVFPEGTFVSEEGVRPFQLGAFNAAVATGAQVVPVSLAGTRRFLRDGTYLPRPTSVTITLSAPVRPKTPEPDSSDWHEVVRLRDATREQIARHSGEPLL
jgi:1-acyl-sn-glycerol-3-phosphate acyltransferase